MKNSNYQTSASLNIFEIDNLKCEMFSIAVHANIPILKAHTIATAVYCEEACRFISLTNYSTLLADTAGSPRVN